MKETTKWSLLLNMGLVYLIEDVNNNTFKIGVTKQKIETRLKKLQTGNSTELKVKYLYECEYPFRLENMLHMFYNEYVELNEWFGLPEDKIEIFLDKCVEFDTIIHSLKDNPYWAKKLK